MNAGFQAPTLAPLAEDIFATGQMSVAAMAWAAQAGFRSVINNRPDFEGGAEQPTAEALGEAARAQGLEYAHLPVSPSVHSEADIAAMGRLIQTLPRPILAFCRSGARTAKLYMAATEAG
jgi:uncharacterized protein (TIGR01244 family)